MKKGLAVFIVMGLLAIFPPSGQGETKIPVFVSILPQSYFLERIGGNHVDVEVLIGKGQSEHTYEPTPKQTAKLAGAKAYFSIGVPPERAVLRKIRQSHKSLLIVETQKGTTYRYLYGYQHDHDDDHGTQPHARSGGKEPDPHIWMSPRLVKIQAQNIYEALCRLDPVHKQEYAANLSAFQKDLDRIDVRLAHTLAPFKGSRMYVFHPAFGYFADAYGLIEVPFEVEGKEPSARQLADLINRARQDGVKVIFVQPQFSPKSAEAVAKAIGGIVVPINHLARDYIANLESIAAAVEKGFRGKK
ncbi:MAG: zinc transport system substrate-binding protein znuA [Syntrophus sp. SKADARSKE-3]|nr:zinc transport system substrate-binding protein znuA [Syntrophus sp. SKADARSKE-3]